MPRVSQGDHEDPHLKLEDIPFYALFKRALKKIAVDILAHEAKIDPHTGYVREVDPIYTDLIDGGFSIAHQHTIAAGSLPVSYDGEDGEDGPPGRPGRDGAAGVSGASGSQGLPGDEGEEGPAGPPGLPGVSGPTGATGLIGPPGDDGEEGPAGPPGRDGVAGAAGTAGASGAMGLMGPPGDEGESEYAWPVQSNHDISAHNGFPGGTTTVLRGDGTFGVVAATVVAEFHIPLMDAAVEVVF